MPRALSRRLALARGELAHASGALRPRLLADRVEQAGRRLIAARFGPTLIERRLAERTVRVAEQRDRLPRAFSRRLMLARGELAQSAGALRPRLLGERIGRERAALSAVRLRPALIERPLAEARADLDRLWRLAASLHPEKPLQRGYAWVERRQGGVVATAAAARTAGALTLHFADGKVDAKVERQVERSVERGAASPYGKDKPEQPTLL